MPMKRYGFWITLAVLLLVFGGFFAWYYLAGDDNRLRMEDIAGDREELEAVEIGGVLADDVHKTTFRFVHGQVRQQLSSSSYRYLNSLGPPAYKKDPDFKVNALRVAGDALTKSDIYDDPALDNIIAVHATKASLYYKFNNAKVPFMFKTEVTYVSPDYGIQIRYYQKAGSSSRRPTGQYSFKNVHTGDTKETDCTRRVGDKTYVFTRTGRNCSGYGGVFEISDMLKGTLGEDVQLERVTSIPITDPLNLAPIDLKDGQVQIFGMESAGDKLIFLTLQNNRVVLKPFDVGKDQFMYDVDLGLTVNPAYCPEGLPTYAYAVCGDTIVLEIEAGLAGGQGQNHYFILDHTTGKLRMTYTDPTHYSTWEPSVMLYKGEKLYILQRLKATQEAAFSAQALQMTVCGPSTVLYRGKIVSDATDDALFRGKRSGDSPILHDRGYYALTLK